MNKKGWLSQAGDTIIFDMDGTLIDSVGVWNDVDAALIKELGGPEEDPSFTQRRRDELLTRFRADDDPYVSYCGELGKIYHSDKSGRDIMKRRYEIAQDFLVNRVDYKEGAPELIKKLASLGKTLVISTTTKRANMEVYRTKNRNIREKALVDKYFVKIYTREDAERIKPDAQIHEKLLAEMGKKPEDCFIFEDSLIGVRAAKAAGIPVAAIYDKYSDAEREEINALADMTFDSFADVLKNM